jgi:formylglycine-generating enzyme required for sulfatase activity
MRSHTPRWIPLAVAFFCLIGWVVATTPAARAVSIQWVTVGNPGNAADTTGYGAVAYTYLIGKYEVTNAQYAEFLNAVAATDTNGLYNPKMDPDSGWGYGGIRQDCSSGSCTYSTVAGREDMPVNHVQFWGALRFANWLQNGQPSGAQDGTTTEDGAYTITALGMTNNTITRNAGATIFIPSEDEWYKAAYYDASATSYAPYPFADGFNGALCESPAGTTSHSANCDSAVGDFTDVGSYTASPSGYGTLDQGGNISEWNETIIYSTRRGVRGGSFVANTTYIAAAHRGYTDPYYESYDRGFRVAMIPEPGTGLLLMTGMLGLAAWLRRSA